MEEKFARYFRKFDMFETLEENLEFYESLEQNFIDNM